MVDPITIKRLVIMKQIFSQGQVHRQKHTQINNMLACHHYDLSIEMLLRIICTDLNIKLKQKEDGFWKIWDLVDKKVQIKCTAGLSLIHEIEPLRTARNSIQHSGTVPSDSDVERFEGYTRTFLEDTIKKVFSIDYEQIRLFELINDNGIKRYLEAAEKLIDQNDFVGALEKISIVFDIGKRKAIKNNFENEWAEILSQSQFFEIENALGHGSVRGLEEAFEKVEAKLNMLALNIDYREYINFKKKSFRVYFYVGLPAPKVIEHGIELRTKEDADFCYNFVLNSFITWEL